MINVQEVFKLACEGKGSKQIAVLLGEFTIVDVPGGGTELEMPNPNNVETALEGLVAVDLLRKVPIGEMLKYEASGIPTKGDFYEVA